MAEQSQQFAKNEQVDQMIDQYIKDNPKSLDYYTKAVKENPDRAIRMLILKDVKLEEVEQQRLKSRERYNKAADAVIEEFLSKKENREVKQALDKRYENSKLSPEVKQKNYMRDAKLALEIKGIDLAPKITAELTAQKQAQNPGRKV